MFNISRPAILLIAIIIIISYFYLTQPQITITKKDTTKKSSKKSKSSKKNTKETYVPSRKILNKKYLQHKRIYVSPKTTGESIREMTAKLHRKLINTKVTKTMEERYTNVSTPKYTLKLFFANWCGHCTNFKPIWNSLKSKYSNNINFIDVDCSENGPELPYVKGFPTIAIYKDDKYIKNYEDGRTRNEFESFLRTLI